MSIGRSNPIDPGLAIPVVLAATAGRATCGWAELFLPISYMIFNRTKPLSPCQRGTFAEVFDKAVRCGRHLRRSHVVAP
jgi:hypothetical protein